MTVVRLVLRTTSSSSQPGSGAQPHPQAAGRGPHTLVRCWSWPHLCLPAAPSSLLVISEEDENTCCIPARALMSHAVFFSGSGLSTPRRSWSCAKRGFRAAPYLILFHAVGGDTRLQPRSDVPEAACPRLRNCDPGAGQPALCHARAAVADSAGLPRVLVLLLIAVRTQPVGATCRLQVQTIANQEVRFADPPAGAVAGAAFAHADADRRRALLEASGQSAARAIGLAAQPEDGQVVMFDGRRKGPGRENA